MDWKIMLVQSIAIFAGVIFSSLILRVAWNRWFRMPEEGWPILTPETSVAWFCLISLAATFGDAIKDIVDAIGKIP